MSRPVLLLVEDDPAIARTIVYALQREGIGVDHVGSLRDARLRLAPPAPYAALLLDVGLPDGSGLDLCREMRARGALPVIMLSARGEEMDRVLGLELGADDYVTKPFSLRELIARVRSLLRRVGGAPPASGALAPAPALIERDGEDGRFRLGGVTLRLTRREQGLLHALWRRPGKVLSREQLLDEVWGNEVDSLDRTVDTHVKTLRAKLRALRPDLELIVTHRGHGYSLELPAEPPGKPAP